MSRDLNLDMTENNNKVMKILDAIFFDKPRVPRFLPPSQSWRAFNFVSFAATILTVNVCNREQHYVTNDWVA